MKIPELSLKTLNSLEQKITHKLDETFGEKSTAVTTPSVTPPATFNTPNSKNEKQPADNVALEFPDNHLTPTENFSRKVNLAENEPLKLAVVGHTNTGKTSLLRTLLRDVYFGEVKNAPATTRHVEKAMLTDSQSGENLVALYDTPGLEDASGLLDWLEENTARRRDGIERLQQFLASPVASEDFSQEAKVIRQLLASDMAIYVIDAREPVLGKYKDELAVLSWSAIPDARV